MSEEKLEPQTDEVQNEVKEEAPSAREYTYDKDTMIEISPDVFLQLMFNVIPRLLMSQRKVFAEVSPEGYQATAQNEKVYFTEDGVELGGMLDWLEGIHAANIESGLAVHYTTLQANPSLRGEEEESEQPAEPHADA